MTLSRLLAEAAPADAETNGRLKWVSGSYEGRNGVRFTVKMWVGKSQKPKYFGFVNAESRDHWIAQQIAGEAARDEYRAKMKADSAKRTAEMAERLQVGAILSYTWGYDQTNVDFFQVVERKKMTVVVREIGLESVPGSEGHMCDRVKPAKDVFVGPPMTKRIMDCGISMDHGFGRPISENDAEYRSWYA